MRVLQAHVRYRRRGGEDVVADLESEILTDAGVSVERLVLGPSVWDSLTLRRKIATAASFPDHRLGRRMIADALNRFPADVVHFHNLFPVLGVGAIAEAADRGCATVLTLHNYRLSCIRGTHELAGSTCERCAYGAHTPGVLRGCYRESRIQSVLMAEAQDRLWRSMTTDGLPHVAVCLTDFAAARLEGHSLMTDVVVKPNSVSPGDPLAHAKRSGALYVGRLSPEKGISELVTQWPGDAVTLTVIGEGPLFEALTLRAGANVRVVGAATGTEVRSAMRSARCLVLPSLCWEGLPMTMLEALSEGTPIVGYGLGGSAAISEFGPRNIVPIGNARALASAANDLSLLAQEEWQVQSSLALALYQRSYTHSANLEGLLTVYDRALQASVPGV